MTVIQFGSKKRKRKRKKQTLPSGKEEAEKMRKERLRKEREKKIVRQFVQNILKDLDSRLTTNMLNGGRPSQPLGILDAEIRDGSSQRPDADEVQGLREPAPQASPRRVEARPAEEERGR